MREEFNSQRIFLVHQHGCRFIVLEHQMAAVTSLKTLHNKVFSHDVTAAILVSQDNETAAMVVSQTNLVGVELSFCDC